MMNRLLLLVIVLMGTIGVHAQEIEVIKYPQLLEKMKACEDGDIHIFNFWATWCKPCIEELPLLEAVNDKYPDVTVHLISFDDVNHLETRVKTFVQKRGLNAEVCLLDETDYNAFIDLIDPQWSGAIPATVIIDCESGTRLFYERAFKNDELESIVKSLK